MPVPGSSLLRCVWRRLSDTGGADAEHAAQHAALDARLRAVEASVAHLEPALEGLQDALYRRSQLDDERNDELLRRTEHGTETHEPSGEGVGPLP